MAQGSKVWGEVPLPEDLEAEKTVLRSKRFLDDDEDFAADEASGGRKDHLDKGTKEMSFRH